MSRIGRKPIAVPAGVDLKIDGQVITVKGPKGELSHTLAEPITLEKADDGSFNVVRPNDERKAKELHGLSRTLIANMVQGVTEGYRKSLEIAGTGYRVTAKGADLEFALGFSHPVRRDAPAGDHVHRRAADAVPHRRHRQAAGGRDRRQHPQDSPAGAVQGQGRAVPGRGHPPQGWKGRQEVSATLLKRRNSGGAAAARRTGRARRHFRIRKHVSGTAERPRLVVTRSLRHITAQIVDDLKGHTLASASTLDTTIRGTDGDKKALAARSAPCSPSGRRPRVSARSSSTVAETVTPAASRPWLTPPAKPDSILGKGLFSCLVLSAGAAGPVGHRRWRPSRESSRRRRPR